MKILIVRSVMLQQLIGTINLSLPLIIVYQFFPMLFYTQTGIVLCACIIGILVYVLNWYAANNMIRQLRYSPTDIHKEQLEAIITQCNMQSSHVRLLYAYTNEQLAMATFNTIILDPVVWSSISFDPEAAKVFTIFEQFTEPTLSTMQKQRINEIKKIFSPDAQTFILKHELAHVYYHFSVKKLALVGLIGFLATYISIIAAIGIIHISGILAICVGILVGCISDLLFNYLTNALFKVQAEKNADIFAAKHSSIQEITAAANFFEKHQYIVDTYKENNNLLSFLPSIFTTGHPNGKKRAHYLRSLISKN